MGRFRHVTWMGLMAVTMNGCLLLMDPDDQDLMSQRLLPPPTDNDDYGDTNWGGDSDSDGDADGDGDPTDDGVDTDTDSATTDGDPFACTLEVLEEIDFSGVEKLLLVSETLFAHDVDEIRAYDVSTPDQPDELLHSVYMHRVSDIAVSGEVLFSLADHDGAGTTTLCWQDAYEQTEFGDLLESVEIPYEVDRMAVAGDGIAFASVNDQPEEAIPVVAYNVNDFLNDPDGARLVAYEDPISLDHNVSIFADGPRFLSISLDPRNPEERSLVSMALISSGLIWSSGSGLAAGVADVARYADYAYVAQYPLDGTEGVPDVAILLQAFEGGQFVAVREISDGDDATSALRVAATLQHVYVVSVHGIEFPEDAAGFRRSGELRAYPALGGEPLRMSDAFDGEGVTDVLADSERDILYIATEEAIYITRPCP